MEETKTLGEARVRTQFNPSADSLVDQIKQKSAELMILYLQLKTAPNILRKPVG